MYSVMTGITDYEYCAGVFDDLDAAKASVEQAAREKFPDAAGVYEWTQQGDRWWFGVRRAYVDRADDFLVTPHTLNVLQLATEGLNAW